MKKHFKSFIISFFCFLLILYFYNHLYSVDDPFTLTDELRWYFKDLAQAKLKAQPGLVDAIGGCSVVIGAVYLISFIIKNF